LAFHFGENIPAGGIESSQAVGKTGAMPKTDVIHIYLPDQMQRDAAAGQVNIINRIAAAVAPVGCRLVLHRQDPDQLARAVSRKGRALFHMIDPVVPGGLTLRRAYHYPFWQIEATGARGAFDVAGAVFDANKIDPNMAKSFHGRLRDRVLGPGNTTKDGHVFMPLQGLLSQHRSFQSMSPLAMIEVTLQQERHLPIRATLHPKESYDTADLAALEGLERRFSRFRVVQGDALALLRGCDYVVTQNSGLALNGFLLGKPAVLFAQIDFHHIAGSVPRLGVEAAFAAAKTQHPNFAAYLYWFFKLNTINAGAAEAEDQIRARLRRHGWLA
jgi:hypothetical protein